MNSKEIILNRIAGAAMPPVDYPAFDFTPLRFEDRTAAFAEAVKAAGGQVVAADGNPFTELIRRYYPDAKTIASVLPEAHATINPDTVDDARKLIDIDLGVIDGCFGVAENGAVWIRQDIRHKALYFGATALMILIPRDALVDTMHEALARPELDDFEYGCFMSGPSKTADIEQALVFRGARSDVDHRRTAVNRISRLHVHYPALFPKCRIVRCTIRPYHP